jgi:pyridinium-3,5-biscarboxylic acid mononucleotide sulfurtransferase
MLSTILKQVSQMGLHPPHGKNVVAFSGGVDSSLVAKLVYMSFPTNSYAILGVSSSLSQSQYDLAQEVSKGINIPLIEVKTNEGDKEEYIKNEGNSCYVCKTHLYTSLNQVVQYISSQSSHDFPIVLFNGTNKDDTYDTTRVGLKAG